VQSQAAPLTEQQSVPYIEQYLQNRTRLELSNAELKRLRGAAKIEYVGDFGKKDAGASPAAVEEPTPEAKSGTAAESDEAIQKGLKGLGK
jgi:hypothetical protein